MVNNNIDHIFTGPILKLAQRLCMGLTICCGIYVISFLLIGGRGEPRLPEGQDVSGPDSGLILSAPGFDLKPYDAAAFDHDRDIFSFSTDTGGPGADESTPKGQLPAHLKIVGVVVADKSQVIIEDAFAKQTYFIDEGTSQAGIKIVQVGAKQVLINYRGEDISIPVTKN
jgi:hypothetical protein